MMPLSAYWDTIESDLPEIWPGSQPWTDPYGSFGSIPDADGLGSTVYRTRVPRDRLALFWDDVCQRYPALPRISLGPRETPGLSTWLAHYGYTIERRESVMVFPAPLTEFPLLRHSRRPAQEVAWVRTLDNLKQVIALDHVVFHDPIRSDAELEDELQRIDDDRSIAFVPDTTSAKSAGGFTVFHRWALLWGGETHPDYRNMGYYKAVLAARLKALADHDNVRFVAVNADEETSAPILWRLGFLPIGHTEIWKPPSYD